MRALTPRQQRFVDEYLIDLDAAHAAMRAHYAYGSASTLLRRPHVAAAVKRAMAKRAQRTRVSADQVLREYARIAFTDIRRFTDWGPEGVRVRPPGELSDDDAAAVAEISVAKGAAGSKVKLHDKERALFALAKHLGLFEKYSRPPGNPEFRLKAAESARAKLRARIEAYAREMENESREKPHDPPKE